MLLSYSDKQALLALNDDLVEEGLVTDFFKLATRKFFSKSTYVSTKQMDDIKVLFAKIFILSLPKLKFKKLTMVRMVFDPDKILEKIKNDLYMVLTEEIQNEDKNEILGLMSPAYYKFNTSLVDECLNIVERVIQWIEENFDKTASEVFHISGFELKSTSLANTYKKFKELFLFMFKTTKEEPLPQVMKLAHTVIKHIKTLTADRENPIDIYSMFSKDDKTVLPNDKTADSDNSEEEVNLKIAEIIDKIPVAEIINTMKLYSNKYKVVLKIGKHPELLKTFTSLYKTVYSNTLKQKGLAYKPTKNELLSGIHNYIGDSGFSLDDDNPIEKNAV